MRFQQIILKRTNSPIFTKSELKTSLKRARATEASIANLLSRAVKRKDLIRLKAGIYCVPEKWRSRLISPFELLSKLDAFSYVTSLTALSYFDLIPEAIGMISVHSDKTISGQKPFCTEIGTFKIIKVPRHFLLFGVDTVLLSEGIEYRMATPLKAILDYAFYTKKVWPNRKALIDDLRLDEENIEKMNWGSLEEYKRGYNHSFMTQVCEYLHE